MPEREVSGGGERCADGRDTDTDTDTDTDRAVATERRVKYPVAARHASRSRDLRDETRRTQHSTA